MTGCLSLAGVLGGKEKAALAGKVPDSSSEWLKQFDAVLPGYSLKGELDLLTLLRQVSRMWGFPPGAVTLGERCWGTCKAVATWGCRRGPFGTKCDHVERCLGVPVGPPHDCGVVQGVP